jgi:hypothetical protein
MTSTPSGEGTGSNQTPKVADAFFIWCVYCREIESDLLRFYNVDIRDWYRGDMDSRRLLTLLDGLPNDSSFKLWAVRGGDWTEAEYVQARLVNEVALSRADGKGYMPELLRSPMQVAHDNAADEYRNRRHQDALRELCGEEQPSGNHS